MTEPSTGRPRPPESSRFALWVYGSLFAFVVVLTLSYFMAAPVMSVVEKVIRGLFL